MSWAYFSTEDMYEVGFGWDDHVRLRETLGRIKGKFLLSYNDCPEIRELYDGFSLFDFSRTHSMAQRYEAGKEFKELLIANYDYYERENAKPKQLTLFDIYGDENYDYEKILKESIISCKRICIRHSDLKQKAAVNYEFNDFSVSTRYNTHRQSILMTR